MHLKHNAVCRERLNNMELITNTYFPRLYKLFLFHFMDPPTLATTALFTPFHPATPVLYLGGAIALTTVVVCRWMVEKTLRARREARLSTGTLYRSESEIELMDYTRIPDAEKPPTEREDEAIFM